MSTQTSPTLLKHFENFEKYFQNRPHTTPDLEQHVDTEYVTLKRQKSAEITRTNAEMIRQRAFDQSHQAGHSVSRDHKDKKIFEFQAIT